MLSYLKICVSVRVDGSVPQSSETPDGIKHMLFFCVQTNESFRFEELININY